MKTSLYALLHTPNKTKAFLRERVAVEGATTPSRLTLPAQAYTNAVDQYVADLASYADCGYANESELFEDFCLYVENI